MVAQPVPVVAVVLEADLVVVVSVSPTKREEKMTIL
jgi:hypothetical protein